MKLKLKNREVRSVYQALFSLGYRINDLSKRWEFALLSEPFLRKNDLISIEIDKIIQTQGEVGEKGIKEILPTNKDYQALMDCEVEVEFELITLEQLQWANPSIEELIILKPMLKVGD
ncbi:MAG: hypothetical protein RR623_07925 [Bacilli bacterium]